MKKIIPLIIFLIVISCKKYDSSPCFISKGLTIKKVRPLSYFNELEINNVFDVVLIQDSVYKVIIEGGENLLQYVSTDVIDNSVLILDNNIDCEWAREYEKITVYVHFDSINDITPKTACTIRTSTPLNGYEIRYWPVADMNISNLDLNCNRFFLKSSETATGLVELKGSCQHLELFAYGSLSIDTRELASTLTFVTNESIADFYVFPTYLLKTEINNSGNVYYNNENLPIIIYKENSSGRLIVF